MKRKIMVATLCVLMILTSVVALTACRSKEFVPENQGSKVMSIDHQDISGQVVSTYNKFNEFDGSEYANMHLDDFSIVAKKSFYTRKFFRKNKLVVTKFNDTDDAKYFINSIKRADNVFDVTLVRLKDINATNPKVKSFALFLEVPTKEKIKDAKVNITVVQELIANGKTGTSLVPQSETAIDAFKIDSIDELNAYGSRVNEDTKKILTGYDNAFFEKNFVLALDYKTFENHNASIKYSSDSKTFEMHIYCSDHYTTSSDRTARFVRYIPIERGTLIDSIKMVTYWEYDFGSTREPEVTTSDYTNYSNK